MKTKNVILVAAMILQMGMVLGSEAQKSVNTFPRNHERKIKELVELTPGFIKVNHPRLNSVNDEMNLQNWMLNPEEWANTSINETTDPQINLENWMLDPLAMVNTSNSQNEVSADSDIELKDWMLDPDKMSTYEIDEKVEIEQWMLNPTKW